MPLKGSYKDVASKIAKELNLDNEGTQRWEMIIKHIEDNIIQNATITGTTPNGGPLMGGKIT